MEKKLITKKVSVIIPAFNEEGIVCHVIKQALKAKEVSEVILVNDGSADGTEKAVLAEFKKEPKFVYLKHRQNKGKGKALRTGVEKAKEEIILFLDADLKNMTVKKIRSIYLPVLTGEVDVSRGAFSQRMRRVTDFAVKPMLKILFPKIDFQDPITGQVCAKKSFLQKVSLENHYGVDIALLLDAMALNQRIMEVNIGKLKTKNSDVDTIKEMARQVLETMIKKAGIIQHKYSLVLFALDNTIIDKEGFSWFFKKLQIEKEIARNNELLKQEQINQAEYFKRNAKLFEDMDVERVTEIAQKIPLVRYAREVIEALKKRKYKVALISANFSPMVEPIAKILGVDFTRCVYLEIKNKKYTGELSTVSKKIWLTDDYETAIKQAYRATLRKTQVKPSQTVVVAHNEKFAPLFRKAGLSVAYKPESKLIKDVAAKTINVPAEILAIIE